MEVIAVWHIALPFDKAALGLELNKGRASRVIVPLLADLPNSHTTDLLVVTSPPLPMGRALLFAFMLRTRAHFNPLHRLLHHAVEY